MSKRKERPKSWQERVAYIKEDDWRRVFIGFEWCCEWASYWLGKWAFLEVLEYLGKLSILVALIVWIVEIPQRRQAAEDSKKSKHYVAWQTINSALGKPGNAGRLDALRDLNQDGVQLDGISLSGGAVIVGPLMLTNASMTHADLSAGNYEQVNFSLAQLYQSKWNQARCEQCDFRGADFAEANFSGASFWECDFGFAYDGQLQTNTYLGSAHFSGIPKTNINYFSTCSFVGANFSYSEWNLVKFHSCNFAYANLDGVQIGTNVTITGCNLFGASNASPEFLIWAYCQPVILTNIISFEKWLSFLHSGEQSRAGSSEFMAWASNQWTVFMHTNDPQKWYAWRNQHLSQ
jgi:uncharacterized protein YjbI with pentapeptide repeats